MNQKAFIVILFSFFTLVSKASFEVDTLRKDGYYVYQNEELSLNHVRFFGTDGIYKDTFPENKIPAFHSMPSYLSNDNFTITKDDNNFIIKIDVKNRLPYHVYDGYPTLLKVRFIGSDMELIAIKNGKKKWVKSDSKYRFIPY